ncbi:hypothetical protein [Pedobacter sp. KBW06]|uniref:hypothetical protein n=1 Tax=Pedobacter sp. KBW06 TaxID=2153359 RepID=UPI0018F4E988|nr:hypothetical protein [Pedobacter sp. KBW06]
MEYVIQLLENEKKALERVLHEEEQMRKNMKQATKNMKNIGELKRAIKVLKIKTR